MGCFFGCFRIKDDKLHSNKTHLVAESNKTREAVKSQNCLSSLLLTEEGEDSLCKDEEIHGLGSPQPYVVDKALKDEREMGGPWMERERECREKNRDVVMWREKKSKENFEGQVVARGHNANEYQQLQLALTEKGGHAYILNLKAKFLKACGAIPETPFEIRKATEKLKGSPLQVGDSETSTFHSWLPNTSIEKLQLDKQSDQPPTPNNLCEHWGNGSDSSKHTPSSCISNSQNTGLMSTSSTEASGQQTGSSIKLHSNQSDISATPVTNVQRRIKSVHFDCAIDEALLSSSTSSSGSVGQNWKKLESSGTHGMPKPSPFSTPLELTDEMQTPGTVFPANLDYTHSRKNPRIRSQYVYSTLNPVGNFSLWNELKEEDSNLHKLPDNVVESLNKPVSELNVDASLAPCLKPASSTRDGNIPSLEVIPRGNPYFGRTPGDRPILGTVAAHWNGDEPYISPKMWDGNGIPNSTNKYKEDQKVSWHATPFEERLEKALSEESSVFQRKDFNGAAMTLDDNEENDTAASHLQSLTHPKSVISF